MRIAVFVADGSEEIEAITPIDLLRRAGANVDVLSVNGEFITGSHGVVIKADKLAQKANITDYDGVVIPGGMPGAVNIANNNYAIELIKAMLKKGNLVSAICASPAVVLANKGLLGDKKATCYPATDFIELIGKRYTGVNVEVDGNVITANGPKSALEFSVAICKYLKIDCGF